MIVVFLASFILSLLFLLPEMADLMNWELPGLINTIVSIPHTGLSYMGTFFHELGHTVTAWMFGYPALPTFDFAHGGGMTYNFEHSWFIWASIEALLISGVAWLWRQIGNSALYFGVPFLLIHLALSLTAGKDAVIPFMGHGAEILLGSFFLLRTLLQKEEIHGAERWVNVIAGFFFIFHNLILSGGLMLSDVARLAYSMQKDSHDFGDFSRIADMLDTTLPLVAGVAFGFGVVFLVTPFVVLVKPREE